MRILNIIILAIWILVGIDNLVLDDEITKTDYFFVWLIAIAEMVTRLLTTW